MTSLVPALEEDLPECLAFLSPREYRCVGLTDRINRNGTPVLPPIGDSTLWILRESGGQGRAIRALYLKTSNGILFHCSANDVQEIEIERARMREILLCDGLRCAIGEARQSSAIEALLARPLRHAVDYDLMTRESALSSSRPLQSGVVRATEADLDRLFPLQEGYEREEVLLSDEVFSPDRSRALLKAALTRQIVYIAVEGEVAVAKAGTNARGFDWDQIGGVYTLNSHRGRGNALAVMSAVIDNRLSAGKKVALFVKTGNTPAKKLYEKLGFLNQDRFRIAYW